MTNEKKIPNQQELTPEEALEPMGSEPTKDDGSARKKLIDVAIHLFAQNGLEGTSTRDIAKAAGVNISLISYYFGGKEGLYKAVFQEFATEASAELEINLGQIDIGNLTKDRFCKFMNAMIGLILDKKFHRPDLSILFQREMIAGLPHAREVYENVFNKLLERVVGLFKAGQENGFVRKDINPYIVFLSLVHATDCYMHVNKCSTFMKNEIPRLPGEIKKYQEQVYKLFIEGVLI